MSIRMLRDSRAGHCLMPGIRKRRTGANGEHAARHDSYAHPDGNYRTGALRIGCCRPQWKISDGDLAAQRSAEPEEANRTSAIYKIPAGAVTLVVGTKTYTNSSPGRMSIVLASSGDYLTLTYAFSLSGFPVTVVETSKLAKNSWTTAVLMHPGTFSPSPQELTAATASAKGSTLQYNVEGFNCELGINGTASSSSAPDAVLPDENAQ